MTIRDGNAWIHSRASAWQDLARRVADLRRRRRASLTETLAAVDEYRNLARDLAGVRRIAPGTRVSLALESLYVQLHAVIHRSPHGGWRAIGPRLRDDVPAAARELAGRILAMAALMGLCACAGAWLVATYPQLIGLVASDAMIEHVEGGTLWTDGLLNIVPSSLLSINILSNNIMVSLLAACAGLLFGLGTFYLVGLNGFMLGATFAFVAQHGLALRLFTFIVAHGPVELSVICIAGAVGVTVGDSLIRPTHATRRESFQRCVARMAPLLGACAVLLVGSGFIEGYVSPDPQYPLASRAVIGGCYWFLMVLLLCGRLLPRAGAPSAAP